MYAVQDSRILLVFVSPALECLKLTELYQAKKMLDSKMILTSVILHLTRRTVVAECATWDSG